jgi:ABC-type multidrug transport system permease subunit
VLSMSTMFLTTLSITRERERGTMENLMAMPVRPIEIMLAKIVPYIVIGYIQVVLILAVSAVVFQLPIRGSVPLLLFALGLFIASNLALGLTFSTVATNQLQAQQLAQFTLLPSFMLSGFFFPFRGMPVWAQWIGEVFPTTHAMRVVRGMLLKGNGVPEILPELWPMALFTDRPRHLVLSRNARLTWARGPQPGQRARAANATNPRIEAESDRLSMRSELRIAPRPCGQSEARPTRFRG